MSKETIHAVEATFPAETPTLPPRPSDPDRSRNANGHRETCVCTLCKRIQARLASGRPTYAEERAIAAAKRAQKAIEKKRSKQPKNVRERQIATEGLIAGAIAGQAVAGVKPSLSKALEIGGIGPSTGYGKAVAKEAQKGIEAALARVGITDDSLAEVAARGLEAKEVRLIIKNGEVVDVVEVPDFHGQHKFWRDLLMVKGHLGSNADAPAPGGLIIVSPTQINNRLIAGHSHTCQCESCRQVWEEETRKELRLMADRTSFEPEPRTAQEPSLVDPFEENDESAMPAEPKPTSKSDPPLLADACHSTAVEVADHPADSKKQTNPEVFDPIADWEDD